MYKSGTIKTITATDKMIRLNSFNRLRCGFVVLCSAMLLMTTGCNRTFMNEDPEVVKPTPTVDAVYMAASIAVRATQSDLASNSQNAEDEVAQLRILAFNSATGKLAINKFYGAGERDRFSNQTVGTTAAWKGAFQILPGNYDFFFIANEDSWPDLKASLQAMTVGVSMISDLYKKDYSMRIPYGVADATQNKVNRTFFPTTAGAPGHLILATRSYKNVTVLPVRNGKGGSATDPQHFEAEGDERVELIRTLAKVKVRIPNSATAEPDGVGKYKIKKFLPSRIQKISLKNEMRYQSLFLNPFLTSSVFPDGAVFGSPVKFSKDWYALGAADAPANYVLYDRSLTALSNETGLSVGVGAEVIVPAGTTFDPERRYDCTIWFYVPEYLREALGTDPATPGMVADATGLIFEKVGASGGDEFGIWQSDFAEGQQKVFDNGAASQYYVLPNAALYSKFSVVRNNVYDITVSYKPGAAQLMLQYKVLPWDNGGTSGLFAMDAFNVYTADPTFKNAVTNIILSTTTRSLAPGDFIELKAKSGFSFVSGTMEYSTIKYGASAAERVFRYYRTVQLKAAAAPVPMGTPVFEVWNQGKLLYTVNASAQ